MLMEQRLAACAVAQQVPQVPTTSVRPSYRFVFCFYRDPQARGVAASIQSEGLLRPFNLRHMVFERLPLRRGMYLCGGLLNLLHLLRPRQLVSDDRALRTSAPVSY